MHARLLCGEACTFKPNAYQIFVFTFFCSLFCALSSVLLLIFLVKSVHLTTTFDDIWISMYNCESSNIFQCNRFLSVIVHFSRISIFFAWTLSRLTFFRSFVFVSGSRQRKKVTEDFLLAFKKNDEPRFNKKHTS